MLSVLLLLQPEKDESLRVFFKKRFIRIGLPAIFWTIIYFLWDFLVLKYPFSAGAILQGVLNGAYSPFWYIYLLLGLYLLTPLLRVIIAHAGRTLIKYFVILWFLSVTLTPFLSLLSPFVPNKNVFVMTSYVGYFILGIYLSSVQIRRRTALSFMLIGTTLTALGTYLLAASNTGGSIYFFQEYLSPTVIFASVMAFLFLQTIKPPAASQEGKPSLLNKFLKVISQNTLGIYFVHVMIIESIQWGFFGFTLNRETLNPIIEIPLLMTITLLISIGIILALKKVPKLKNFVT